MIRVYDPKIRLGSSLFSSQTTLQPPLNSARAPPQPRGLRGEADSASTQGMCHLLAGGCPSCLVRRRGVPKNLNGWWPILLQPDSQVLSRSARPAHGTGGWDGSQALAPKEGSGVGPILQWTGNDEVGCRRRRAAALGSLPNFPSRPTLVARRRASRNSLAKEKRRQPHPLATYPPTYTIPCTGPGPGWRLSRRIPHPQGHRQAAAWPRKENK